MLLVCFRKIMSVLSAHKNHLTALPAELDHISGLAVLNLTGNLIQHLPVSFMKLRKVGTDISDQCGDPLGSNSQGKISASESA